MPIVNQVASIPVPGGDQPFKNYGLTDIPANTAVLFDSVNVGDVNGPAGIVVPTNGGGVARTAGVTVERIPPGCVGRVRIFGGAVAIASGAINPGDLVQIDDTTPKMGCVELAASTNQILGKAMSAAVDGDPVLVWVCPVAHN